MDQSEFAEFYERYLAQCVHAGVEPLTPEAMQARLVDWQSMGLSWDTGPQGLTH